jgi:hypothetical protein
MPCVPFQHEGMRGIICGRGLKVTRCAYCPRPATLMCDWPKRSGTCDRAMCEGCALEVDQDLHQCRAHSVPGLF